MKYENIPYRVWQKNSKTLKNEPPSYRRAMRQVDIAIKRGAHVSMDHRIVNPEWLAGQPYDVIDVEIIEAEQ